MEHHQIAKKEAELRKGPWHEEEDETLIAAVSVLGERRWDALAKASGLRRSGKSCRLRWMNYLRPNLKHGHITQQEKLLIIQLHKKWGNRWSRIARSLPGRTDNEIKNYWRSHLRKKALLLQQEQTNNNGSTTNDSEQNSMVGIKGQDSNASSCSNNGDYAFHGSDDNLRTCGEFSSTVDELNSLGLAYSSPYESRLMDWTWLNCCKMETFVEDCHPIPGWVSGGYSETGLWDTTLSIWDMD